MNLFRNGSLSNIGPGWFFMFPRLPVIGCRPFFQSRAKRFFEISPLSANSFSTNPLPLQPRETLFSSGPDHRYRPV